VSPVTLNDRVVVPDGVLSKEIDGETVVLNLESGVYFGLDPVATDMWRGLQIGAPLNEVASALETSYEVEPAVLRADLLQLVNELVAKGLVKVAVPGETTLAGHGPSGANRETEGRA